MRTKKEAAHTPKTYKAPPGLDYDPVTGADPNLSYGVVKATTDSSDRISLQDVIVRRLFPVDRPVSGDSWPQPTASRWDVLLPRGAPDEFLDPVKLCTAYHAGDAGRIIDLAAIITIRFPGTDSRPQTLRVAEAYELGRGFGRELSRTFDAAAIACFHVPAQAWRPGAPHLHICLPLRHVKPGSGFATFITELIDPVCGRKSVDELWDGWKEATGHE